MKLFYFLGNKISEGKSAGGNWVGTDVKKADALGEGTGAALFNLIEAADRIMSEMAAFEEAGVVMEELIR